MSGGMLGPAQRHRTLSLVQDVGGYWRRPATQLDENGNVVINGGRVLCAVATA